MAKTHNGQYVPYSEHGEALGVAGLENSCAAKGVWFNDGHISTLREHYEGKIRKLEDALNQIASHVREARHNGLTINDGLKDVILDIVGKSKENLDSGKDNG